MANLLIKTSLLASLSLVSVFSFAQDKKEKKDKLRIKVEQEIDGKNKVYEKTIDASNLSAKERDEIIQKYQDSLMTANKGKSHRIKIEVEDESSREDHFSRKREGDRLDERRIEREESYVFDDDNDSHVIIKGRPKVRVYRRGGGDGEEFESDDFMKEFRWEMDGLKDNLKTLGKDFKMDFRSFDPFDSGASSKTIKGLDAFPNKPNTETLNVRFNAPEKGNVTIKVLDVKGNTVATEELKDFSGDYIGQLKLGKTPKGTLFVMVSQGEDAAMKRLVLE